MGHGPWMGFAWGHMEHMRMALKHNYQNFTCFNGQYVLNFNLPEHQNLSYITNQNTSHFQWVVGSKFQVLGDMFRNATLLKG